MSKTISKADKVLKQFYKHFAGTDDYGCKDCLKYRDQLLNDLLARLPKDNPYPESIFVEPTKEQLALLVEKLKEVRLTLDVFSGSIGRLVFTATQHNCTQSITDYFKGE